MKRIVFLLTAVLVCGTLVMNGQARKGVKKPAAKARTTAVAKKKARPATPASDLPLFCLKGKVKKLVEKTYSWTVTEPVFDSYGMIDDKASKRALQLNSETVSYFTEDGFLSGYEKKDGEGNAYPRQQVKDAKGRLSKSYYDDNLEGEDFKAIMTLKRNAAGEIISYSIADKANPGDYIQKSVYTLRPDGRISKSKDDCIYENSKSTYSYDANGFLIKTAATSVLSPEPYVVTIKYDPQTDSHGNWLKATDADGNMAIREIEYYE